MRHADVGALPRVLGKAQVRARFRQPGGHRFGGAHRRGGLENHQVALAQHRRHRTRRRADKTQVRFRHCVRVRLAFERRRHRDQKRVRRLRFGGGVQVALFHRRVHGDIQLRLDNMDLAPVDGVHRVLVHVHADHLLAAAGEDRGGGQADVAQADDTNGVEIHKRVNPWQWGFGGSKR